MATYNGFNNYETWNLNLWYGDSIFNQIEILHDDAGEVTWDDIRAL